MLQQSQFISLLQRSLARTLLAAFLLLPISFSVAQPKLGTVSHLSSDPSTQPLGRDFYFAMPRNYDDGILATSMQPTLDVPWTLKFGTVRTYASRRLDATISNPGRDPIVVVGVAVPPSDFSIDSAFSHALHIVIPQGGQCALPFIFTPTTSGEQTVVAVIGSQSGNAPITLHGNGEALGVSSSDVFATKELTILASPNPMSFARSHELTISGTGAHSVQVNVTLFTILGEEVARTTTFSSMDGSISSKLDVHSLSAGDYIYRVECAGVVTSGRVAIQK